MFLGARLSKSFSSVVTISADRLDLIASYRYVLAIVAAVYAVTCVPIMLGMVILGLVTAGSFYLMPGISTGIHLADGVVLLGLAASFLSYGLTLFHLRGRSVHAKLIYGRHPVFRTPLMMASGALWPLTIGIVQLLEIKNIMALEVVLGIAPGLLASFLTVLAKTPRRPASTSRFAAEG